MSPVLLERLIEAYALCNARMAKKIDDARRVFTESMLEVNFPHYMRPFPACSIAHVDASAASGQTRDGIDTLPRGTLMRKRINASPDKYWKIPLEAPDLPETFFPQAKLFGAICPSFDMGLHPHGWNRNKDAAHPAGDPFHGERELSIPRGGLHGEKQRTDAARGNEESEAALQYEYHASLRMMAKREGKVGKDKHVTEEDRPETASAQYTAWRHRKIQAGLAGNVGTYATDHSTILTNSEHSRKALAYDVAVGCCHLLEKDLRELRTMADWRFLDDLGGPEHINMSIEYFYEGKVNGAAPSKWVRKSVDGVMPKKISDLRENNVP